MEKGSEMKKKAQISGPFEIMVAVTIMVFVMILTYSSISNMQKKVCENKIKDMMQKIKATIEDTLNGGEGKANLLHIEFPSCFGSTQVFIDHLEKRSICSQKCSGIVDECYLLVHRNYKAKEGITLSYCLDVGTNVEFSTLGEKNSWDAEQRYYHSGTVNIGYHAHWRSGKGVDGGVAARVF